LKLTQPIFSDHANPPTLWLAPANAKTANPPTANAAATKTRISHFMFFKAVGPRPDRVAKAASGGGKLPI
jgi:hypothetical protein